MSKPEVQNIFQVVNGAKRPTILMSGYVGKYCNVNSDDLRKAIAQFEKDGETDVDVLINSGGGSTMEGLTIGDFLSLSNINFHGIVIGMAASMGGGILMFCNTRSAYKNARIMTHKVKAGAFGESAALRSMADLADQEEEKIIDQFVTATGQTKATVLKWFKPGIDKWFTAKDALKEGLITNIIEPKKAVDIDNSITDEVELLNAYEPMVAAVLPPNNLNIDNSIMKKAEIIAMLVAAGFAENLTSNATDEQLSEVLQNVVNKAKGAETAQNKLDGFLTTNGEALIGEAVKAGKIQANEKAEYLENYKKDPAFVTKAISKMTGKIDPNDGIKKPENKGGEALKHKLMKGREDWTFDKWTEEAPEDLEIISNEAPDVFDELFNTQYK